MKYDIKVPAVGESITEATIGSWQKKSGEKVNRNDVLLILETDKASVEVVAENAGVLNIAVEAGKTIPIGSVVGAIDSEGSASIATTTGASTPPPLPKAAGATSAAMSAPGIHPDLKNHLSPAVQKIVTEKGLNPADIEGTGRDGRLTKEDVARAPQGLSPQSGTASPATEAAQSSPGAPSRTSAPSASAPTVSFPVRSSGKGEQKRVPMTTIRKRIAERLVQSQQTTATLTTFNEIDMSRVMDLRAKYKDKFKERYGLSLGFMGFFVKAAIEALKAFPAINGWVEGNEIVYNMDLNIGVAVGTEKGLIVPVIKNAGPMTIAEIENQIRNFAGKARDGKISIDDLSGGTFTISNGGVYGSLLSTPILNPPQSGILGMHKIEERPMAINGKVEIRPMMYVALSYDHRIVDGKEAVGFLVKIKEGVEDPERLLLEI